MLSYVIATIAMLLLVVFAYTVENISLMRQGGHAYGQVTELHQACYSTPWQAPVLDQARMAREEAEALMQRLQEKYPEVLHPVTMAKAVRKATPRFPLAEMLVLREAGEKLKALTAKALIKVIKAETDIAQVFEILQMERDRSYVRKTVRQACLDQMMVLA